MTCFILQGLFITGARWNRDTRTIDESFIDQHYDQMPIIILTPREKTNEILNAGYDAPVYRTPNRCGKITKSGHSTNFVTNFNIKCEKTPSHWIERGVALLFQH